MERITYSNYKNYLDELREALNKFSRDHNLSLYMLSKLTHVTRTTMHSFLVKENNISFRTASMIIKLLASEREIN